MWYYTTKKNGAVFKKNAHTKIKNVRGKKHHIFYHKSKQRGNVESYIQKGG